MKVFKTGMVSVTFRKYSPEQVIAVTQRAELEGIEWGGDIHVPHGDIDNAKKIGRLTREAGLEVISYGSYYRAGSFSSCAEAEKEYKKIINTAEALGTNHIRVWAGSVGSLDADEGHRKEIVSEMKQFGAEAESRNLSVSFEYHQGTLTDDCESATLLIEEIGCKNIRTYWQPNQFINAEKNFTALKTVVKYVTNVHVFAWNNTERYLLSEPEHYKLWERYLDVLKSSGKTHSLLLEFSHDGSEEAFLADAETLKTLI